MQSRFLILLLVLSLTACGGSDSDTTPEPIIADFDLDGIPDNEDTDDDNDDVPDVVDAFPLDPTESVDTDNDGIGNNADTDDDNDDVPDVVDIFPLDPTESVDTDNDGIGNNADTDDDNDDVPDVADAFPLDPIESVDTDNDGIGNNADTDDDNDNVLDTADAFPLDPTESVDTDNDGIGNNADTDDDNDNVPDTADAFPLDPTESVDTDNDGIGNNADTDDDNDNLPDTWEIEHGLQPLDSHDAYLDPDGDGVSNLYEFYFKTDPNDSSDFYNADEEVWGTYQGNASHDGAVFQFINEDNIAELWRIEQPASQGQVIAGNGKIYVIEDQNSTSLIKAIHSYSGQIAWQQSKAKSLAPVALLNELLYIQTVDELKTFNAASGNQVFSRLTNEITNHYNFSYDKLSPVPFDESIYHTPGLVQDNSTSNFVEIHRSQLNGEKEFTKSFYDELAGTDTSLGDWSLTINDDSIFMCSAVLETKILNRHDGEVKELITDTSWPGCAFGTAISLGRNNNLIAQNNGNTVSYDYINKTTNWRIDSDVTSQPAVGYGRVFVVNQGILQAHDELTGEILWKFAAQDQLNSNIIVAVNKVIVANGSHTYIIDPNNQQAVELNAGGQLTLNQGVLYVATGSQIVAYTVDADDDNDGLPNWWEKLFGLNINDVSDATINNDNDNLSNLAEYASKTDPLLTDSDGDGLTDSDEVNVYQSNPNDKDSDNDGMPDSWEIAHGLAASDSSDADEDFDTDGYSNFEEYYLGSDPANSNSFVISQPWGGQNANTKRNGFVSQKLNDFVIEELWRKEIRKPQQVVGGNGKVYLLDDNVIKALDNASGELIWKTNISEALKLSLPAFGDNQVYFQTIENNIGYINAVNSETGELVFKAQYSEFGQYIFDRPSIYKKNVYVSSSERWFYSFKGFDRFGVELFSHNNSISSPVIEGKNIYLSENYSTADAMDWQTGAINRVSSPASSFKHRTIVSAHENNLITRGRFKGEDNDVYSNYDLNNQSINWSTHAELKSTGLNIVYGVHLGNLNGYDLETGELIWQFDGAIFDEAANIIVTRNKIIAKARLFENSPWKTYVIDIETKKVNYLNVVGSYTLNEGVFYISNSTELVAFNVSPFLPGDTDNDGLQNYWEYQYGFNLTDPHDASVDTDADGLSNLAEFLNGTNPLLADTDNDGLSDGEEVNNHLSNPLTDDTDGDGLTDIIEVSVHHTDPNALDSDNDGLSDYLEIHNYQSDPNSTDSDADGMDDSFEIEHGLNINQSDAHIDTDNDGLTNLEEYIAKTNLNLTDTDRDGLSDGAEVHVHFTDPTRKDTDLDKVPDNWELNNGFSAIDASDAKLDADNDGFSNMEEYFLQTDPYDSSDFKTPLPWSTYQGNANHDSFVLQKIESKNIHELWRKNIYLDNNSGMRSLIAASDYVYAASNIGNIQALEGLTGEVIWQSTTEYNLYSQLAIGNDLIYFNTNDGDGAFIGIDIHNGEISFSSPIDGIYRTISSYDEHVYVGPYAFNQDGSQLYRRDGDSESINTLDQNNLYACTPDGHIAITDRVSGDLISINELGANNCASGYYYGAIIKGSDNNLIIPTIGEFVNYNLNENQIQWRQSGRVYAVGYGVVYAISHNNKTLFAYDELNGGLLWRFDVDDTFYSQVIVTREKVIVSTESKTFVINIDTQEYKTLDIGGELILNENILYITQTSGLKETAAFMLSQSDDNDNDGLPNSWESEYGLDMFDAADAMTDLDADGLTNLDEFENLSHPRVADTDFDGLTDGDEVNVYYTSPSNIDSDNDGYTDNEEITKYQTDAKNTDSFPRSMWISFEENEPSPKFVLSQVHNSEFEWQVSAGFASEGNQSYQVTVDDAPEMQGFYYYPLKHGFTAKFVDGTLMMDVKVIGHPTSDSAFRIYMEDFFYELTHHYWSPDEYQTIAFPIKAGVNTIDWKYELYTNGWADFGTYIDNIRFIPD